MIQQLFKNLKPTKERFYYLYPEVKAKMIKDEVVFLKSPWISFQVNVCGYSKFEINKLINRLNSGGRKSRLVTDFLKNCLDYPIFQSSPLKSVKKLKQLSSEFSGNLEENFFDNVESICSLNKEQRLSLFKDAKVDAGGYDSYVAYLILRRLRILQDMEVNSVQTNLFNKIKSLREQDKELFGKIILCILYQQFYVTTHCVDALSPALQWDKLTNRSIIKYIQEEVGHEKLVFQSIEELYRVFNLGEIRIEQLNAEAVILGLVFPETIMAMEILKLSAKTCFFAFCCILPSFEGNGYKESDSIVDLLQDSDFLSVANGINTHFKINTNAKHHQVGEKLVQYQPYITDQQLLNALYKIEEMSKLQKELLEKITGTCFLTSSKELK